MLSKAYILDNVNVKLKYHMNPYMTINIINKASLLDYLHFKIYYFITYSRDIEMFQ